MNESDIKRAIALGVDWSAQEHAAYFNAGEWLRQSAAGHVPHGGMTLPTKENPVEHDEPITMDGPEMMPFGYGNE